MESDKCICELSEGEEKKISNGSWLDLYISLKDKEYYIDGIGDGRASIRINFCPICGKKLIVNEDQDKEEYI